MINPVKVSRLILEARVSARDKAEASFKKAWFALAKEIVKAKTENRISLPVVKGTLARATGLQLSRSAEIPIETVRIEWEKSILEHFRKQGKEPMPGSPFLTIEMPCGKVVQYQTFADIPSEDVPCPCGDPKHWVVRYTVFEARPNIN